MRRCALIPIIALALAACGQPAAAPPPARDTAVDPLVQAVLTEPLLTDIDLRTMANADSVRPPPRPHSAMIPLETPPGPTTDPVATSRVTTGG